MSETQTLPGSAPTPDAASTPPSTPSSPAPASPSEYRFGDNAPAWARGRSPEEVLGIASQAVDALSRFNQQPQALQQPAAHAPQGSSFDIADDDYLTGAQAKRLLQQASQGDPVARQIAASTALAAVRNNPKYAPIIAKYPVEFEAVVANLPLESRTVDNLESCVKFVMSNHLDDLAAERAQQIAASVQPTIRSGGGGGSAAGSLNNEQGIDASTVPQAWRDAAKAKGISDEQVREFAPKIGMSVKDYYEMLAKLGNAGVIRG